MTPAIHALRRAGVAHQIHEYAHDPQAASYGLEAAEKLGVAPERVFKTLVARVDGGRLVVGVVPVDASLDLKALAAAVGGKRAEMAEVAEAERATGYVAGGISPIGQKKRLDTVIDESAAMHESILVSAGRRGVEIELGAGDLVRLTGGRMGKISTRTWFRS